MPTPVYRDRVTYRTGDPLPVPGASEQFQVNASSSPSPDYYQVNAAGSPTPDYYEVGSP